MVLFPPFVRVTSDLRSSIPIPSEKACTLTGTNLIILGADGFLLDYTRFRKTDNIFYRIASLIVHLLHLNIQSRNIIDCDHTAWLRNLILDYAGLVCNRVELYLEGVQLFRSFYTLCTGVWCLRPQFTQQTHNIELTL